MMIVQLLMLGGHDEFWQDGNDNIQGEIPPRNGLARTLPVMYIVLRNSQVYITQVKYCMPLLFVSACKCYSGNYRNYPV